MKVYIAGASKEITRAERWAKRLAEFGIEVTSTWIDNIRKVGKANPADATIEQYKQWAINQCLHEVEQAGVFWLLLPECDTVGAYVELGRAFTLGRLIVMSGRHRPIFTPALAQHHSHYDAEIADYLRRLSKADAANLPTPRFRDDDLARDRPVE
jgi:hypothetical protein